MAEILGPDRRAALCRELTKRFEEVRRAPLGELAAALEEEPVPRGEIVIVIGPPGAAARAEAAEAGLDDRLRAALAEMSLKDAVRAVQEETGLPRRQVYARALALSP